MAEKLKSAEQDRSVEAAHEVLPEVEAARAEKRAEAEAESTRKLEKQVEDAEKAAKEVEEAEPIDSESIKKDIDAAGATPQLALPSALSPGQAQQVLRIYLGKVRHHLSNSDQAFSKFIHNPGVSKVSEVTGRTIIRPSGILSGGFFTLFGSALYLYATHTTGYSYSFSVALALFVCGFLIGVLVEMAYRVLTRNHQT